MLERSRPIGVAVGQRVVLQPHFARRRGARRCRLVKGDGDARRQSVARQLRLVQRRVARRRGVMAGINRSGRVGVGAVRRAARPSSTGWRRRRRRRERRRDARPDRALVRSEVGPRPRLVRIAAADTLNLGIVQLGAGEIPVVRVESALPRQARVLVCLLYTSPSPRDKRQSRMPSSA